MLDNKINREVDKKTSVNFNLKFHQPVTAYALQLGGWLPLALTSARILLVDRNIVGLVDQISGNSPREDLTANRWWFEFIDSSSVVLNPLLCAMEGRNQRIPSFHEFREQFDQARETLIRGFPKAYVVSFSSREYVAAYEIIRNLVSRHLLEKKFLLKISPLILNRRANNDLRRVENEIYQIAKSVGIVDLTLVLIAALACLYESRNGTGPQIGRKLLKPSQRYNEALAHNALSDLRALELLLAINTLEGPQVAFCTRDKYLTAFWCAIQANDVKRANSNVKFNLMAGPQLFPRLDLKELKELEKRIKIFSTHFL